jgi:DnaJ-class molecular chaperone
MSKYVYKRFIGLYFMDYYKILGLKNNASIDEIKKKYRNIALKCHPDKLNHINDINIKNEKIDFFKTATDAYKKLLNKNNIYDDDEFGLNILNEIFQYLKKYKCNSSIIKHNFTLNISYENLYKNSKIKIRLLLKNIKEPIFFYMDCSKYPKFITSYIDNNCIEHEITLNMVLEKDEYYDYIINEDNTIDLIYKTEISFEDYINGFNMNIIYIDYNNITINIPPFTEKYIHKNYGLKNGDLIIYIKHKNISAEEWNNFIITYNKKNDIRI